MRVVFRQTAGEFARSWLHEYYRQSNVGQLRRIAGPLLIAVGLAIKTLARADATAVAAGTFFIYYGIYLLVRPLLLLGLTLVRRRKRIGAGGELTLELDERGVRIADASSSSRVGWGEISGAGARREYAWVEIRGGSRLAIPRRAIGDFDAFEDAFRERRKWRD
jgi:hypothetical protein